MALEQTWRWFGPHDPVSFREIRQTGATGIVTALHQIPAGEVWPVEEIVKRKALIEEAGFTWSVVESIPVHEEIKTRTGNFRWYTENYKESIRNLGRCGIDMVCYNFMPGLDWSRTDLNVTFTDGSITTRFESRVFAAFDLFILQRPDAGKDYSDEQVRRARGYFDGLNNAQQKQLTQTILLGFPGSGESYSLDQLRQAINRYGGLGDSGLRQNLYAFVKEIVPVAEESGVLLAIHPDDPPWSLLGLPRVVGTSSDLDQILEAYDSPSNGLTLCTGSLGAGWSNDVAGMAARFARRVTFVHLRNVSRSPEGDFLEENHLGGDVDMAGVMKALVLEQKRREKEGRRDRRMPFRPDHGHLMIPDLDRKDLYPGYSLFGRMRGLAEMRGLELGIRHELGL